MSCGTPMPASSSSPATQRPDAQQGADSMFVTLTLLLAVLCLVPAIGKLSAQPKIVATANHFGIPWERYRLIGFAELVAAIGVLIGLMRIGVGVAAAGGMALLLLGALATHRRAGDDIREAIPGFVVLGICVTYLVVALVQSTT